MNRKNKVTRRRVNDSVIDSVLNDVYDEIDKLQVSNEYNIASSNVDNQGEYTTYSSPGGANYFAINTESGWMVDVNSQFEPISDSSFRPSVGVRGITGLPTKHESLKYNDDLELVTQSRLIINASDEHLRMQAADDTVNDYATFHVANTGDLTIATVGDGSTDSDLTLDIDGNIELNAAAGEVIFKKSGADLFAAQQGTFDFNATSLGEYARLRVAASDAETTLSNTTNGTTADAHINIDAGGDIVLDAGTGYVKLRKDGDTNDAASIRIEANGETTIATEDDGGAVGHLTLQPDGNILLKPYTDGSVFFYNASNIGAELDLEDGSHTRLKMYENGGESGDDYCQIEVGEHGATTITTHDDSAMAANLTLDIDGDIELNADGGDITIKNDTQLGAAFKPSITNQFYMYSPPDTNDYFRITTAGSGATTIETVDNGGESGILTISADGIMLFKSPSGGMYSREVPSAGADATTYGQIWVKDDSPNNLYFTDDTGQDVQITNNGSLVDVSDVKVSTVTISEAEMNALHTTEKVLVAAQGGGKVVIPIKVVFFVDRDSSLTQTGTGNMFVGMDGSTTISTGSWGYLKRFMWNEGGDRIIQLHQGISDEVAQTAAYGDNKPLTAKLSSAITLNSIDSCKVVTTYYVYDNS